MSDHFVEGPDGGNGVQAWGKGTLSVAIIGWEGSTKYLALAS